MQADRTTPLHASKPGGNQEIRLTKKTLLT